LPSGRAVVLRIESAVRSRPCGLPSLTPPRLAALRAAAFPPGRPGRPSARRRRLACPELRWVKSALSHAKVKSGRGNPRLRRRCAPCTVPPRTYRPSLRQDRTAAGYAVKALLARSVLACGCAPLRPPGRPWRRPPPCDRASEAIGTRCHSGAGLCSAGPWLIERAGNTVRACSGPDTRPEDSRFRYPGALRKGENAIA